MALKVRVRRVGSRDSGQTYELNAEEGRSFTVGRAPDCDVVIADDKASRRHATIEVSRGRVILTDNKSTNGVYLDGAKITRAPWRAGDIAKIGGFELTYAEASSHATHHAPSVPKSRSGRSAGSSRYRKPLLSGRAGIYLLIGVALLSLASGLVLASLFVFDFGGHQSAIIPSDTTNRTHGAPDAARASGAAAPADKAEGPPSGGAPDATPDFSSYEYPQYMEYCYTPGSSLSDCEQTVKECVADTIEGGGKSNTHLTPEYMHECIDFDWWW